jgi:hypothetical protein
MLPIVLYGYETWSDVLIGEHRPKGFQNRVKRRIFEPTRHDIIGQ